MKPHSPAPFLRDARFTEVRARQFAIHEVLGHGLQCANFAARWPTRTCRGVTRVRLDHYLQLVRAELHQAINAGATVQECAEHARARVPFWTDADIADVIDWFVALSEADATVGREVHHAAYREPLTPGGLRALWPGGPPIGGPGRAVRLRKPALP